MVASEFTSSTNPTCRRSRSTPKLANEDLRLAYRYLDLRRAEMGAKSPHSPSRRQGRPAISSMKPASWKSKHQSSRIRPRRGARFSRSLPAEPGLVLRFASGAAAIQAASPGCGAREIFPDRPLFPGRRFARRPPAGVYPDRHRSLFHHRDRKFGRWWKGCSARIFAKSRGNRNPDALSPHDIP